MEIRLLRADEIECRIGTISDKGLSLLLYKDARADMKILDETFGCLGWKRTHQSIDGNLYCTVEIWDSEKKEWISKQDVGTVSYTEKEKGQASDSFKRACVSVGIGRELYSAPFVWVSAQKCSIQRKGDKLICYDKFQVSDISYNKDREITTLSVINCNSGEVVYSMFPKQASQPNSNFNELNTELNRTGEMLDTIADLIFVAVCFIKLIPVLDIPLWLYIWLAVIVLIRIVNIISGFVIQKRFIILHTTTNKLTGALLFILPFTLQIVDLSYSAAIACCFATFAAVQEGHYIRTGKNNKK